MDIVNFCIPIEDANQLRGILGLGITVEGRKKK
jgi:hypothetical protein